MDRYEIRKYTAKEVMEAGCSGTQGGSISGTHYALYEIGKGLCSLDGGRTVFMLVGKHGKDAMQRIIDHGGFVGEVDYMQSI